jgi:predicted ATPase
MRDYARCLGRAQGALSELQKQHTQLTETKQKIQIQLEEGVIPAQVFLQKVAQDTQSNIQLHIENIVQLALDAVFPDRYEFKIEFEMKRGKTEASLSLYQEGEAMDPMTSNGGGVVDILALALRISAYTLSRSRNVIILDEPMRFVSKDLQEQAAKIIKHLSERLNIQFIITTHSEEIIDVADKVFKTIINSDGISEVIDI